MGVEREMSSGKNEARPRRPSNIDSGVQHDNTHSVNRSDFLENQQQQLLVASASSPSLLTGCGDTSMHAGARIERHVHAHHILTPIVLSSEGTPQVQDIPTEPLFHNIASPTSDHPPDSLFLTSSLPRSRQSNQERPYSAPANYLEKISGQLLRLVGDHYLCSNCGRQLRNIGDQLTIETTLSNAWSSGELHNLTKEKS